MRTLTMPLPIFKRGGIVGVRIAIVAEMRAGIKIYFLKYTSPFIYRSEMHFRVQKMGKLQRKNEAPNPQITAHYTTTGAKRKPAPVAVS